MNSLAAQAQALFAEQTDSQLTQGSATAIHSLPNISPASLSALPDSKSQYSMAQYTPSAQEAATGAYSVPKPQVAQQQPAAQKPSPHAAKPSPKRQPGLKQTKRTKKKNESTPTLGGQAAPTAPTRPSTTYRLGRNLPSRCKLPLRFQPSRSRPPPEPGLLIRN